MQFIKNSRVMTIKTIKIQSIYKKQFKTKIKGIDREHTKGAKGTIECIPEFVLIYSLSHHSSNGRIKTLIVMLGIFSRDYSTLVEYTFISAIQFKVYIF